MKAPEMTPDPQPFITALDSKAQAAVAAYDASNAASSSLSDLCHAVDALPATDDALDSLLDLRDGLQAVKLSDSDCQRLIEVARETVRGKIDSLKRAGAFSTAEPTFLLTALRELFGVSRRQLEAPSFTVSAARLQDADLLGERLIAALGEPERGSYVFSSVWFTDLPHDSGEYIDAEALAATHKHHVAQVARDQQQYAEQQRQREAEESKQRQAEAERLAEQLQDPHVAEVLREMLAQ